MPAADNPNISLVVTARNDDHGGNFLARLQTFLNCLTEQCTSHRLSAELVVVEWNPPADRPRLSEALEVPESPCRARFIEVPASVHARYEHAAKIPLYQMIAKNVGIRRARAPWILATNIDILFNDELMRFLASGAFDRDAMYRIDRHDAKADVPLRGADFQLAYCSANLLRVMARDGVFRLDAYGGRIIDEPVQAPGLGIAARAAIAMRERAPGLHAVIAPAYRRLAGISEEPPAHSALPLLHTNACGDFTLLHRDHWFALRGYHEFDGHPMNIDSLLCWAALAAGCREVVLAEPMRIYHMEHGRESDWTFAARERHRLRTIAQGIPWFEYAELMKQASEMLAAGRPAVFNDGGWGFGAETFAECEPAPLKSMGAPRA